MGLDMYLYSISKSKREEGFVIDCLKEEYPEGETLLSENDYETFPENYKHYLVKGQIKRPVGLADKVISDFLKIPFDELTVEKIGSSTSSEQDAVRFLVSRTDGTKLSVKEGTTVIEDTDSICVSCECEWRENYGKFVINVVYQFKIDNALLSYRGNYISEDVDTVYSVEMDEIDYQRKGLTNEGWGLLPENCSYCGDRTVVEKLCKDGGLSMSFLNNWEDGVTLFYAWW